MGQNKGEAMSGTHTPWKYSTVFNTSFHSGIQTVRFTAIPLRGHVPMLPVLWWWGGRGGQKHPKTHFFREINGFEMWMRCGDTDILSTILDAPIVVLVFSTFGMFQTAEVTAARPEKDENAPAWSLDSKSAESRKANFGEMIFEGWIWLNWESVMETAPGNRTLVAGSERLLLISIDPMRYCLAVGFDHQWLWTMSRGFSFGCAALYLPMQGNR